MKERLIKSIKLFLMSILIITICIYVPYIIGIFTEISLSIQDTPIPLTWLRGLYTILAIFLVYRWINWLITGK